MTGITLINLGEVQAGVKRRLEDITRNQAKAAKQMGVLAVSNIQNQTPDPMHVDTSAWQKSIDSEVNEISATRTELIVASSEAEDYFAVQEALHHPMAIGWHRSTPEMTDIYKRNMKL